MGTRTPKIVLFAIAVCLAVTPLLWAQPAESAETEVIAVVQTPLQSAPPPGATSVDDSFAAVYYCSDANREAWITIGANNSGLRPNAEVVFYREGVEVTRGKVVEVRLSDAIVQPAEGSDLCPVRRGDIVRVLQNGTRADLDSATAKQRGWENFLSVGLTALLGGLIAIAR